MDQVAVSGGLADLEGAIGTFIRWATTSNIAILAGDPSINDFVYGNPHDLPMPEYVDALRRGIEPKDPSHFAYKLNEPQAAGAVTDSLRDRFGIPFEIEDVFMTNGNFSGLSVAMRAILDPGDEVMFVSPPWFFYEVLILSAGARPVRVLADRATWDLDLDAITAAITPRTRAIIVNSPNNPTGKIYPLETLERLAEILSEASERNGRPIYVLSDEAYNRVVFDDRAFFTPLAHYPTSFMIYTYGKTHLAPGLRLGYIAIPPAMPDRDRVRGAVLLSQVLTGWAFPVAPLQHALVELERITVDVKQLQRRRDRIASALGDQGYELTVPEGTFYILVRSPLADDMAFVELLNRHNNYVLPGAMFEMSGFFRISVTASDEMVERGIPGFAAAIDEARRE